MTTFNVPYTFIPGTKAKASEVNENFAAVLEHISTTNQNSADINFSNLTDTAKEVIYNNSAPGRLIGEIVISSIPIIDACVHLLDGSLINGEGVYKDFVEYIGELYGNGTDVPPYFTTETEWQSSVSSYGVCGKFVYNYENNTVRLPKITGVLEGTTDIEALGSLIEAGLPNITGTFYMGKSGQIQNGYGTTGAFYSAGTVEPGNSAQAGGSTAKFGFKASNSSSVYGKSEKVQPQAIKQFIYIVIANSKKTDVIANIDNITNDVNSLIPNNSSRISNYAMPSNKFIEMTLATTGSTYTAPADGYVYLSVKLTTAGSRIFVINRCDTGATVLGHWACCHAGGQSPSVHIPVKQGDIFHVGYDACESYNFRFVYAEGSKGDA